MTSNEITDFIMKKVRRYEHHHESPTPAVFLFDSQSENIFNQTIDELKSKDFKFLDINQYSIISPEDYNMLIKDAGFHDETGSITFNDILEDDAKKRRLILKAKLNNLKNKVDSHTVLMIRYNDLFLNDEMFCTDGQNALYETIRSWLKDGYQFDHEFSDILVIALVFLETKENIRDFCLYGYRV